MCHNLIFFSFRPSGKRAAGVISSTISPQSGFLLCTTNLWLWFPTISASRSLPLAGWLLLPPLHHTSRKWMMLASSTQTGGGQTKFQSLLVCVQSLERLEGEGCQPCCLGESLDCNSHRAAGICEEEPHHWSCLEPPGCCSFSPSQGSRRTPTTPWTPSSGSPASSGCQHWTQ